MRPSTRVVASWLATLGACLAGAPAPAQPPVAPVDSAPGVPEKPVPERRLPPLIKESSATENPENRPGESALISPLKEGESLIDLPTALRLAGVQNPDILFARERVSEALAIRQLAAAQALPNINVGLNYNLHRGPLQQSNGNILNVNRDGMFVGLGANAVAAGSVNLPGIYYNLNLGNAWFGYLQSLQVVERNKAGARTAENDNFLRVCLAYNELLRAEARLAVLQLNLSEARELARLTDAYAKSGQGRKADADRATVELRKREAEYAQTEADAIAASATLGRWLNMDSVVRLKPLEAAAVPIAVVPEPVPIAELVAIAMMQRPELGERRAEIREAIYALSNAKYLPFSPTVVMGFSTGAFGGGSNLVSQPGGFIGGNGEPQTGPRFGDFGNRLDIDSVVYFTFQNLGVGNIAMTRAAAARARQADLRQQDTLNRVRAEVVQADARARAKLKQIDIAAMALGAGREGFEQDLTRIKGRQGLPIEVIDSMRLLARSRFEYLDAIIDYNRTQFQLYVALGQPPADSLARPVPPNLLKPTSVDTLPAPVPEKK